MHQVPAGVRSGSDERLSGSRADARDQGLSSPGTRRLSAGLFKELVLHLVKREIDATHRMTVLGWTWPLVRQLVQLAVLVFIFGSVLDLGIEHFPVFVFSGLLAWTWFATGCSGATGSLLANRHLLFQPRLPPAVLPIVAVVVPLVDVLMALPVLLILVQIEGSIPATALFLPLLVVAQLVLMAGVAWLTAASSVFLRDVPNIVAVGLNVLFYLTPVFYGLHAIPEKYASLLKLNPMATIVGGYRAILLGEPLPGPLTIVYTVGLSLGLTALGFLVFIRLQNRFVDNL
jgi:ABC-type polysaccharide/polyol phosphate export permease